MLDRFETSFMISFWSLILNRINTVSKQLQRSELNILQVVEYYDSLINFALSVRENFDEYEKKAAEFCLNGVPEYEDNNKRRKIRKLRSDENESERNEVELTGRENFRISTFYVIIDTLRVELEKRRNAYQKFNAKFCLLLDLATKEMSITEMDTKVKLLLDSYPKDLEVTLLEECIHFNAHLTSKNLILLNNMGFQSLYNWFLDLKLNTIYPNINVVFRLCLCIASTNCTAERSFSAMKRVKNYLRSTMRQEKLNDFSILHIESDVTMSLNYDDIIDQFSALKCQKKAF